jgi:hypothetical protein
MIACHTAINGAIVASHTCATESRMSSHIGHRIISLTIVGGFLDGQSIDFAPGLNCIIGARGTGKTTLLEFSRWAMDALPEDEGSRQRIQRLVAHNLKGGRVDLKVQTKDGRTYTVSRREEEDPIVLDSKGKATGIVATGGGLFRLDVFSQNEVESIADHALSQLDLIDTFRAEDITSLDHQIEEVRADLKASAGQISPLQGQIAALVEQTKTLPTVVEKLKGFAAEGGQDADKIDQAQLAKALRGREALAVKATQDAVIQVGVAIRDLTPALGEKTRNLFTEEMMDGANGKILLAVKNQLDQCRTEVEEHLNAVLVRLREERQRLVDGQAKLDLAHKGQELVFSQLLEKHKEVQGKATERAKLEKERNDLLAKQRQHQELVTKLTKLVDHRKELQGKLSELRDQRYAVRERVVHEINTALSPTITVSLEQYGSTVAFAKLLEEKLSGAGVKVGQVVTKLVENLSPAELATIIAAGDAEALADKTSLNSSQVAKVLQTLESNGAVFDLEVVELLDLPEIKLKDVGTYKPTSTLSTGQKCTAILPILLLDSDSPLLIDQPEDNLDNSFVYGTIVESIRTVKPKRQLIFVTHNPNIPVLGEADRIFVLESDGNKATKRNSGDVDHCKDDIVTLLEGGKEAFVQRKNRYHY